MARYRLTESRLRGLIREAVKSVLMEGYGNKPYLGDFSENNFRELIDKAEECGGNCSFRLCGYSFTMSEINPPRGVNCIRITLDDNGKVIDEFWNIHGALASALNWAKS